MPDTHLPKGVSRETLLDVVRGWYAAGADEEPVHTATVADDLDLADSVSRQTRFLESVGVLEPDGQRHRLTARGARLGRLLAEDDVAGACEALSELLAGWPLTDALRETLSGRSLSEPALVAELAHRAGVDPEGRTRTGLSTLLDCYVWTGLLVREGERYRLADDGEDGGSGDADTLRVGLELSVDLDPDDVEGLVAALRRGLAADLSEAGSDAPRLAADVSVDDDGEVTLSGASGVAGDDDSGGDGDSGCDGDPGGDGS